MKTFVWGLLSGFMLALLGAGTTAAQSGWTWRNPLPQGNALTAVAFADEEVGLAVGLRGTVLRTSDGGRSWLVLDSGDSRDVYDVWSIGHEIVLIGGERGLLLRSTDAGTTWSPRPIGMEDVYGIHFVTAMTGTAVGSQSFRSNDAGFSWVPQETAHPDEQMFDVFFTDADHGVAVGTNGAVQTTNDRGVTWRPRQSGTEDDLHALYMTDHNAGVAVGANGTFLRTTTGGTTWSVQHAPSGDDLRGIWFVNEEVGVAVADARIFRTTDGGQTWVGQTHPGVSALTDVSGRGGHVLVAVTDEGAILRSPDAGETWSQLTEGTRADFRSVARAGSQAFVAVGDAVARSDDAGVNWTTRSGTGNAVAFVNQDSGLIVGSNGAILRSEDGGRTWIPSDSPTLDDLNDVDFDDAGRAWAVGAEGSVLRSVDGGRSWDPVQTGSAVTFAGVDFVSTEVGTIVGTGGAVIRTEDGGASWTRQQVPVERDLYAVSFSDPSNGTIVGAAGTILRTSDGGVNWVVSSYDLPPAFTSDVDFHDVLQFDPAQVVIVGDDGLLMRTTDGGHSWHVERPVTHHTLRGVAAAAIDDVVVVGTEGSILTFAREAPVSAEDRPERPQIHDASLRAFPNPFVEEVTFRLELPSAVHVTLVVYDLLGRTITTVIDDPMPSGTHHRQWRPASLPAGAYLYQLSAGDRVQTGLLVRHP